MRLSPSRTFVLVGGGALLAFACRKEHPTLESSKPGATAAAPAAAPLTRPSEPTQAKPAQPSEPSDFERPVALGPIDPGLRQRPIAAQQDYLLRLLFAFETPPPEAQTRLTQLVRGSAWLGFGNPKIAEPALTQSECQARWVSQTPTPGDPTCGHRNMVRVSEHLCIDQYEFPNVLCEYPVVWIRASEAAEVCDALGKRLCDAHEWEGACAGQLHDPESEYSYSKMPKGIGAEYRRARRILMEGRHNQSRSLTWAYGPVKNHASCGTGSHKSSSCTTVDYGICGTNDYPAGSFPACHTPRGVYDQHGNIAEHMSFPLFPEDLGGRGYTEMKGSWFLFAREETHPDDCRWRAKNWHTTKISDDNSHRNYHLGFRCCADVP